MPEIVAVQGPPIATNPPLNLSEETVRMIHAGLVIPSPDAIASLCAEVLKSRGFPYPDMV